MTEQLYRQVLRVFKEDDVMADLQREAEIVRVAREHGGRFLLRHRYKRPLHAEPTELDLQYDACQRLVTKGKARWMTGNSAPGVELSRPDERRYSRGGTVT